MDDGVAFVLAPRIADALKERGHEVDLWLEHQLLPEAAADLESCEMAIFVDASMETTAKGFQIRPVEAKEILEGLNLHTVGPEWILAMGLRLHGRVPQACLVTVEGDNFDFGDMLTAGCAERTDQAFAAFLSWWDRKNDA